MCHDNFPVILFLSLVNYRLIKKKKKNEYTTQDKRYDSSVCKMSTKNCDVFLRDLESLLKKSLGEETKILSQKVENLLPKGENYGSTILKVSIKTDKEEDLELVAKMTVTTDYQKSMMDCTIAFKKEIFVFEELRPIYEEIQREAGFKDLEILDFFPKFFGSRLSRNFQSQEADEDVVLLMENLKFKGYMQMNRKIGGYRWIHLV